MIGFFDYTVWLTYFSLLSSVVGIFVCLSGTGRPYAGMILLLFCGLFDAFDGKVARTKKDRTEAGKKFGIQIDSLSDLSAFGVLPACIGAALLRRSGSSLPEWVYILFACIYVLAAMIRLAYYNVTEEVRQQKDSSVRKAYTGLPVTSAALVFPAFLLVDHLVAADLAVGYGILMLVMAFAFLCKAEVRKPGLKGTLLMVAIGLAELLIALLVKVF